MARKSSKKYSEKLTKIDKEKSYSIEDAFKLLKEVSFAKFDETVDVAFRLGVDPRHADQMIRGAMVLPNGLGKDVKVLVLTSGAKISDAEAAGADYVGGDELITKIAGGWFDFERVIASPEMMSKIGKIGRLLGPRGLMPNPKLGTVTTDVVKAVKEQKSGKVEYKTEKNGIVHLPIGKVSFDETKLEENFKAVLSKLIRSKPKSSKGTYLKSISLSSTMSPSIKLDVLGAVTQVGG